MSGIASPGGTALSYSYDGSLLTGTTWNGPVAGSVTRTYDTDFRVATESVNGGDSITFQYDPDNLLTAAGVLTLTRSPQHGLLTGTTLGGVTDSYGYSAFGELETYQANYSGSPLLGVTYTRDSLGRITQKVETITGTVTTTAYGYDPAGRLTDVMVDGTLPAHYEYDGNGNRLAVTRPGTGTVSGTYDAQERLVSYGAVSYTHTANGDLQTATSGGETTTYSYDVFGNLTVVALPSGILLEYITDGQNRRIGKKVNGVLVQGFLYRNQLVPVAEVDGSGTVVSRFVYGTKLNVPEYMVKGGVTYRIITDHLGSVRLVLDTATGTIAQRLDYDEFGQITQDTNPGLQPFGFAGGLYDPDTKLVRFGARDYDAFTGRWTAKDPIRFGGGDTNLYGYVQGNPTLNTDPLGLGVCFYSLSTGQMTCYSERPGSGEIFSGVFASGNNRIPGCKNNPDCIAARDVGPIPTGRWYWDPNRKSRKPGGRVLVPEWTLVTNRSGFRTHSCANPFGPSTNAPYCSEGCVTGTKDTIKRLNDFFDREWKGGVSNTLSVLP